MAINILIVGAGKGGTSLIELFSADEKVNIVGIVDADSEAPGMKLAKKLKIPTAKDWKRFIKAKVLDEIIDVTGNPKVYEVLLKEKPKLTDLMSGRTAKTLWVLLENQKEVEKKIKITTEEWGKTFDSITDLIFMQDEDFTITKVNRALAEALKLRPEEIVGKKCYEVLHKRNVPWENCPFEQTRKDKKSHTEEVDDPAIGIPLLVTTSPIFNPNGKFIGSVHIAKSITEIKKTEDSLREKIDELEKFKKVTVERELKMRELKERIEELEKAGAK